MLIILLLLKKLRPILKLQSLKLMVELELLSIRIFLARVILKIGQEKYLLSIPFRKLILVEYIMSYYPEPASHIRDKVKVILVFLKFIFCISTLLLG